MEDNKLSTGLTILSFVLIAVGFFMGIRIMIGYEDMVGPAITLSMILMGVGAGVALLFGLYQLLTNIKKNVRMLIGLAGFAILVLISYSLADDTVLRSYPDGTSSGGVKISEAGIFVMYILIGIAAIAAIIAEVSRLFK
jgi:hypothetical protein